MAVTNKEFQKKNGGIVKTMRDILVVTHFVEKFFVKPMKSGNGSNKGYKMTKQEKREIRKQQSAENNAMLENAFQKYPKVMKVVATTLGTLAIVLGLVASLIPPFVLGIPVIVLGAIFVVTQRKRANEIIGSEEYKAYKQAKKGK